MGKHQTCTNNNENINIKEPKSLVDVDLRALYTYLTYQGYPDYVNTKNEKSNFRSQAKSYYITNDVLFYKNNSVPVVYDDEKRKKIIKMFMRVQMSQ